MINDGHTVPLCGVSQQLLYYGWNNGMSLTVASWFALPPVGVVATQFR